MVDIRPILEKVLQRENEGYLLFSSRAEQTDNQDIKRLLNELAQEDLEHRDKIQSVLLENTEQYMIEDRGALEKDSFLAEPVLPDRTSIKELIYFAIRKKREASHFYTFLAEHAPTQHLKNFYHNLANIEMALYNRLERLQQEDIYLKGD